MYPKRLILDDARNLGIAILGLDVNASGESYRVEPVAPWSPRDRDRDSDFDRVAVGQRPDADLPDGRAYGIRLSLADVLGISDAEVQRILAGQPYFTLADFWHRAQVGRPVVERLVMAGGFDSIYGLSGTTVSGGSGMTGRRGRVTRRDLLLHVAELDRWSRSVRRSSRLVAPRTSRAATAAATLEATLAQATSAETRDVRLLAAAQSQGGRPVIPAQAQPTQLTLDLGTLPSSPWPPACPR